jgi:predicted nucleotidyltransferase
MSLLNEVRKNKELLRIFGKRELKIIEKQLLGVKLKPSEIVRLSRDIRKKFEAIATLSKYSNEFRLKKGAEIKEMINEAIDVIKESKEFSRIKAIYLYGSAVKNELTLVSDIDIAVEFSNIDEKEAGRFRLYVLGRVNEKVDIQVFNILPDKIKKEIENAKILWKKE